MQRVIFAFIAAVLVAVCSAPLYAQSANSGTVNSNSNIRSGPGTGNSIVGRLEAGSGVEIVGCNTDCSWYEIGAGRWIAAFLVDVNAAPVPTAPPTQPAATSAPITIVSWNVESGGALQSVVADRLASFQEVDIWGLSEVNAIDAEAFEFGAEEGEGADYESYLGSTGAADRLLLVWDEDRFDLLDSGQLTDIGQNARAPLWVALRETATNVDFVVMVNHLHRSNEGTRHRQAEMLNAWAAAQVMPIIAIGDYNFDWNLPNGDADHDQGYDNLTKDGVWEWVRPAELFTTQCSGWPCGFNSVLDFVFVTGPAREWNITSEIIVVENDFPDDLTTPDHRPVLAVLNPPATTAAPTSAPSQPASVAPSATSAPVCAQANTNANLRGGPGTGYAVTGRAELGQCLTITGRTEVGDWFQLNSGNWIAAFLVTNVPPMPTIPVVAFTPPTVTPTQPVPPTIAATATPVPPSTPVATATPSGVCDPSYPGVCIPPISVSGDLDCGQIPHRRFQVIGSDPHGFDGDADGVGCESN